MLTRLLYSSHALHPLGGEEDLEILQVSLRLNPEYDITGYLVRVENAFFQILEGPEAGVNDTFERIKRDPRHTNIVLEGLWPIRDRIFGNWAMGYRTMSDPLLADQQTDQPPSNEKAAAIVWAIHKIATADARQYSVGR